MPTNELPAEFALMVACSWAPPEGPLRTAQAERVSALCLRGIAWDSFLSLVVRHQVAALACRTLEQESSFPVPVREDLRRLAARARTRSLLAAGEGARMARALAEARIPVLPLKGGPLSRELYGDAAARHSADVDLLVPGHAIEAAESVLLALGYQPEPPPAGMSTRLRRLRRRYTDACTYRHPRLGLAVDLHWDLALWTPAQVDALWRRSVAAPGDGEMVRRLHGDGLLLYLCDHGTKHNWSSMKWLSDAAMLLARPREQPWEDLFHLARQWDTTGSLAAAAWLVQLLYGLELPPELQELVRHNAQAPSWAAAALAAMRMTPAELQRGGSVVRTLRNQRLRRPSLPLAEHVRRRWLHPDDLALFTLPDSLLWLHYFLRPLFRLWRRLRPQRSATVAAAGRAVS